MSNTKKGKNNKTWGSQFNPITFTESQKEFQKKINLNTITFCYGVAGTSKTFTACYTALQLLDQGKFDKIILTKPIQESGEKLGLLPGTVDEKVQPYLESFTSNMEKIMDSKDLGMLMSQNKIIFKPLAYMRGCSLDNSIMILDEAQNCDFRQLMLYITRLGKNTKVIITGDVSQYDIEESKIAMKHFIDMVEGIDGIGTHEFLTSEIVRNPILIEITERYEEWKRSGKITKNK